MLSYTQAGLYYVYYVVAELLAFLDDIHIHGTDGVGIEMVVYIVDVLALQLIAIVVDFVLDVEREVGIAILPSASRTSTLLLSMKILNWLIFP